MFARRRGLLATLLAAALVAGCGPSDSPPPPKAPNGDSPSEASGQRPRPTFRLALLTDPKGYLAPCGCTSRPLGGIDRMAAAVRALEADGAPVVALAAGSLFFDGVDRGADALEVERWRALTMIEVWRSVGIDAATPGRDDLTYGFPVLKELAAELPFPLVTANARLDPAPAGLPSFQSVVVVDAGGTKVGVVGAADLGAAATGAEGLRVETDAIAPFAESVARARAEGASVVVALASGDRAFANRVADVEGVDFVVRGDLDHAEALPPSGRGGAHLLHAGHQGQGVLVVDVYRRGEGPFADASPWTRRAAAEERAEEADALEARIAEWARDPGVRPEDLDEQRARLAAMRAEVAAAGRVPLPPAGNAFVAEWRELAPDAPRDPAVASTLARFDVRVNDRNREVYATVLPPPAPEGAATYVGSATCGSCHAAALAWWERHPHGRAYATLVERHKEFHLDCVGCHVTGYDRPGGSNVTHPLDGSLRNVGCESCHGPGSLHAANPPASIVRATPESTCVGCHNDEHSDLFDFDVYRRRLIAPGHGAGAGS